MTTFAEATKAAPELLATLEELTSIGPNDENGQCKHCGRDNAGEDQSRCAFFGPDAEDNCPYEDARAAIAKAKGQ